MATMRDIFRRQLFSHETVMLRTLVERIDTDDVDREPLNMDPDYQRGHVWTDDQASRFVGHHIEGGRSALVIINRCEDYTHIDEILDGKQRLTALYRWVKGEIGAHLFSGDIAHFRDFSAADQRRWTGGSGPTINVAYVYLNRADTLRLYLRLNRGGTVHSDEEIKRVRALLESI